MQKQKGFAAYGLFELGKYRFNLVQGLLLGFAFAALSNMMTIWLQWNELSLASSLLQIIIQTLIFAAGTLFLRWQRMFLQELIYLPTGHNDGIKICLY